jgi:hypothetical protein
MQRGRHPVLVMFLIVSSGIAIRVFTALNTDVINPDGMEYIQQAKAIYYGDWRLLKSCMPFVSNYPFFIAGVYGFYSDWIFSARLVSIFFGSLTLLPLFFLIRRFADERTSCLCLLLYVFIPFLVSGSADLIRDPVCWFFLVCGLYFFVTQLGMRETGWRRFLALLSSYAFLLMAGWARPEAFIVVPFSLLYSLFHSVRSGDRRSVWMSLSAPLLLAIIVGVGIMVFDPSFHGYSKGASKKLSGSVEQYTKLRSQLELMADDFRGQVLGSFLGKVRNLVWLNAVGVLTSASVAGIFYPYIPFFVFGFFGLRKRIRTKPEIMYLFTLFIVGYILLFFHILQFWYFEHRFLFIAILPGCVLAAFGIAKINHFAERKFRWKMPVGLVLIFLYIAGFGLGKNIKKRDTDKVIFRQIANYISTNEHSPKQAIPVLTSDSSLMRLVPFYVNLGVQEGFCPTESVKELRNFDAIVKYAEKHNVKYFLWNERHWSKTEIDIHSDQFHQAFTPQGHWFHEECGEIILFHRD